MVGQRRQNWACLLQELIRMPSPEGTQSPVRTEPRARERYAGFTIIELMVVVVIITLLAAIAIPLVSKRMRASRARQETEQVAQIFRTARMNALGRGAATLVRYTAANAQFDVLEGIQGSAQVAGCTTLPASSCLNPGTRFDAGSPDSQVLTTFTFGGAANTEGFIYTFGYRPAPGNPLNTGAAVVDICFTPVGRTWLRTLGGPFTPMVGSAQFTVNDNNAVRVTAIPPTGAARAYVRP
jgi:prepilin-type N-terminal cleavage/methylation domain-containing protein